MAKDDLKIIEQPVVDDELIIIPDLNKAYKARRPQPSTTSQPKVDLGLDLEIFPIQGAERSLGDDELFRKIESDLEYVPNDAELDKFLKNKKQNPNSSVDFIKGAWDAGWGVLGELGLGAKAIASDPIKSLDFFTAEGWERKAANISEGFARATWDLGVLGREFNEMFGRLRDDELREEMQDMKLRQSNPDWRPDGFMGGESYLTKEEKEKMRTTFSTSYIKSRIKDDLEDIADTTNNFQDSADIIKKQFKRKGLAYVEGADKRDYTTSNYIDNVLSDKTKQNWVKDFPDWIKGRERDRWRKSRYLLKVAERARRGDQTILGEFFGKEFDEKFRKIVNPQVATLISYAGGPPEIAAATATRIPRKALTAGSLVTDPLQVVPTVSGKVAEGAGKAAKYTGEKLEKFGEYVTETPARAATVGGLLGAAAARDLSSIPYGAAAGVIEQKIGAIPLAGRALQRTGEAAQAIGEVVGRPGGTEGILKAASRVAPSEETAKRLNQLSVLDPAINLVSDLSKGAGAGAFTGLALTLPSEDAQKIGGGFGGGLAGGFVGAGSTRFLSKGALLKAQQLNDWEQFRKRLSPKQIESIKKYAPDIGQMGQVMNQIRMIEGAITPEGRGNVDYDFLSPAEFEKRFGAARGVVVSGNRVKPEIIINTGWQGPNSMFHEAWHAMKKFAGTLEEVKVAGEGKQEVPVLKPYLEKVQTLLFGQELNGKQVVKGLFDKETILGDFAEQYTKEMTPEQIKTWEQQFSQDPVTKEKFTSEQAEQNKLNYLMEELEAESFRYLMSGSDPRGIVSGQRSLKQKFIDHMLLSEHSKTLRGMKKALSSVGITFKGSGQPSDIFFQKDKKGRYKGLTNSPELNAALRDYVRAWEGLQYRTRYIDEVDPSGFQIGGKGVAGSKVVEFQLKKAENDFLRNHFRSSDIIEKNEDGEVLKMPDGSLSLLNEGQIRKLQEDRSSLIREALERTEDPNGMIPEVHKDGGVSFKGVPTARQLDAIDKIPNKILTPNQKQVIREVSTMMSDDPGAPLQFLYNAAIGKGKRYSSSLSSSHRVAVPLGFHASKAQNFYFTALDLGAYHNKLKAWADDSKKALHKGGHKMELWNKDVKSFEADLFKYLENHKKGIEGETGLDPDLKVAEQKRNVLNDFFNINKGEEGEGNFNPIAAARRATDPKTGKQKKRAYQGLENLIRSYRLDRVLDEEFGKSLSYSLGKRVPMKSQKDFYEKQLENFMTLPKGEEGARFMPPPAEGAFNKAKETFGTTKNQLEAGFILPDGEMLDFSGRHEGADERDVAGKRYSDHREISQTGVEMTQFINSGAVRIDARSGLIEIGKEPTASQLSQIRKIIEDKNSEVYIDLQDLNRRDVAEQDTTIEPEAGTDPKRVIGLIRRFYGGGDISNAVRFMPAPAKNPFDYFNPEPASKKHIDYLKTDSFFPGVTDYLVERLSEIVPGKNISYSRSSTDFGKSEYIGVGDVMPRQFRISDHSTGQGRMQDHFHFGPDSTKAEIDAKLERYNNQPDYLKFMPAPTFFSKAERAVEGAKSGIFNKEGLATIDQAKALFVTDKKGQQEFKVPEAELEWSGVLDYLDLQKEQGNKVSKDDLLNYIKSNGVEIEEVMRGEKEQQVKKYREKYEASVTFINVPRAEAPYNTGRQPVKNKPKESFDAKARDVNNNKQDFSITQNVVDGEYIYTITRKSDNQNIPLDAPAGEQSLLQVEKAIQSSMKNEFSDDSDTITTTKIINNPTVFRADENIGGGPATLPGGENYRELVLKLPEGSLKGGESEYFPTPSGHRFPEDNILAHIRFTERTDADGKKMLFLEEVQSDWNIAGRESGFNKPRSAKATRELRKLEEEKGS
jgi:predicted nucleic acid-binding Zn ribbon protein